jgi:glycosyltransferase involved in cell wall biosynthesis
MKNNRFVFIAPMYNASKTLPRMLHSICGQSYSNWKLFLIDDVSNENECRKIEAIIDSFEDTLITCNEEIKINVYWNGKNGRGKQWEVSNVLYGVSMCEDDDIVCRIDADDWLTDLDALHIINYFYNELSCDTLWTSHRWSYTDKNISAPMPDTADPYSYPGVTSHLKTFRKHLLNSVKDVNFRGQDGKYIKRAGDQAIYLPALKNSKKRVYLPRVMYHYTIDEQNGAVYQTDDAKFQKSEADFIRARGYVK